MARYLLIHGDCLEKLKEAPDNYVSSVVTDPPYGLSFMGKDWDHGIPGVHFWQEILRVCKPGAHLLAFGGTRTFHRLMIAIEDAGWEIRDTLMWVYGSGFPKSFNVSKAIDKTAGAERKVTRIRTDGRGASPQKINNHKKGNTGIGHADGSKQVYGETEPETEEAKKWDGWGSALKPAVEYIICAQKPLTLHNYCSILIHKIGVLICQLPSYVRDAENNSSLNQEELKKGFDSALWSAVEKCNTLEDLHALMDMSLSEREIPSSLSIGLSWLNILDVILQIENTFTTEMKSSLTTDLKILNSLPSATIVASIIEAETKKHGDIPNVSLVESILNVVSMKLNDILTSSAQGLVTSSGENVDLRPNWRPIILARKPIEGTIANNVLKYGTGAINIDECRISGDDALEGRTRHGGGIVGNGTSYELRNYKVSMPAGRFPANLIHDGSEEVLELFPDTKSGKMKQHIEGGQYNVYGKMYPRDVETIGDSGSAARFFYCAKASRKERDKGLEDYLFFRYNIDKDDLSCKEESMVVVQLLKKVISVSDQMNLNIGECGESIMVMCRKDSLSIILMEINKIIELKILNLLISLLTKEYTQGVNLETESGGSPAKNVGQLKKWILTITEEKMELALGASSVALKMLCLIKEEENWKKAYNFHATVKPLELMKYLVKLITPPEGIVLDPFMGSGTTGIAALEQGFKFLGIEKEEDYIKLSEERIKSIIKEK